jgi:hypothetical protein
MTILSDFPFENVLYIVRAIRSFRLRSAISLASIKGTHINKKISQLKKKVMNMI